MDKKVVSIISPVYNGEKYITNYLESVLNQTYPCIELILVDDASKDGTEAIIESYKPKFEQRGYTLICKKQAENKGQAAAINVGLKLFSGSYMAWMDADDIYCRDAIEKKVAFLEQHPEADYVVNQGEIVDENALDKRIGILKRTTSENDASLFRDLLAEQNVVYTPGSILVRTDALKKALPEMHIFESREGQNWQMLLPLAYTCKCGYLNEVLFKYVIHGDSHSRMKRTYEVEMARRKNFYMLQAYTIDKIVGMSAEEKKHWKEFAYGRMLYTQYVIASRHHNYADSKRLGRELKEHKLPIRMEDRFLIGDVIRAFYSASGKIRSLVSF